MLITTRQQRLQRRDEVLDLLPLLGFATAFNRDKSGVLAHILDALGLEGSILDALAEWPASTTREEWFAITR